MNKMVADEYAYQLKKRGTELRRDVEFDMVHSWNSSNATSTRTFGGYQAWINYSAAATTPATAFNVATGATYTAPTNPGGGTTGVYTGSAITKVSLALSHIDVAMQAVYENGGKATKLMLSPVNRRIFSAKAQAADSNVRRNIDESGKLRQSVEIYMSDFGDIMVVPNYIMGLSHSPGANVFNGTSAVAPAAVNVANFSALIYDPMWFSVATLRPLQEVDLGQSGDSIIGQIVQECTLEVRNPKGASLVFGLSGL